MKVYLVQKRYWEIDDDYFVLADTIPLKAFTHRDDAEAFRLLQVLSGHEELTVHSLSFLGEDGLRKAGEYPLFEIIEAELHP